MQITVWCACAQSVVGQPVAQRQVQAPRCRYPPLLGATGAQPWRNYGYSVVNIDGDQLSGVVTAFQRWSNANLDRGLGATYESGQPLGLSVSKGNAGTSPSGLPAAGKTLLSVIDGWISYGQMTISNNNSIVNNEQGYRRVVLHELGHFHGLDDAYNYAARSTVMRDPVGYNGTYVSDNVTACDSDQAFNASHQ